MGKNFMSRLFGAKTLQPESYLIGATRLFLLAALALLLVACGGGGGGGGGGGTGGGGNDPQTPTLSSITVGPASASVAKGLTVQLTATGVYSDSTQKDLSASVNWS